MRLRILKQTLEENIPLLKLETNKLNRQGMGIVYQLINSKNLQMAISEIDKLGLFKKSIDEVKEYPLYTHSNDSILFSGNEYNGLYKEIENLEKECTNLSNALTQLIAKEAPNEIKKEFPNFKEINRIETKTHKLETKKK